ncbi:hypothetical protein Ancab_014436 [Ancistrocladus abbreviatus]
MILGDSEWGKEPLLGSSSTRRGAVVPCKSCLYTRNLNILIPIPLPNPVDVNAFIQAWRLWKEGAALELVDSTLGVYFASEEVMKCIHIGLICIQENAARRPRMTSVVAALSGECINLPLPTAPHFFTQICLSSSNSQEMENEFQGGNYANTFTGSENITDLHPR